MAHKRNNSDKTKSTIEDGGRPLAMRLSSKQTRIGVVEDLMCGRSYQYGYGIDEVS